MNVSISAATAVHPLGRPIKVDVVIANVSDRALVIDEPTDSLAVELHLIDRVTKEDLSYSLGRVTTTSFGGEADQYALVVPVPKKLEIAPRASFAFSTDPNQRVYLRPGVFDGYLTVDAVESNHIELTIAFTRDSVAGLFALAGDPKQEYSRREWATDWLAKLNPTFQLALPAPDATAATIAQMEAENRIACDAFAAWWREAEASPETDRKLERIR